MSILDPHRPLGKKGLRAHKRRDIKQLEKGSSEKHSTFSFLFSFFIPNSQGRESGVLDFLDVAQDRESLDPVLSLPFVPG